MRACVHVQGNEAFRSLLYLLQVLYIACLFTVVLFLYLPIVHLIPFLHYWLEPVSKHFTVRSTLVVFGALDK